MRAGKLRNKVVIQYNDDSRDAYGGVVSLWKAHTEAWCDISAGAGSENISGSQVSANQTFTFTARVNPSVGRVVPGMRVSWNNRTFDIVSASDIDERGAMLSIVAKELGID